MGVVLAKYSSQAKDNKMETISSQQWLRWAAAVIRWIEVGAWARSSQLQINNNNNILTKHVKRRNFLDSNSQVLSMEEYQRRPSFYFRSFHRKFLGYHSYPPRYRQKMWLKTEVASTLIAMTQVQKKMLNNWDRSNSSLAPLRYRSLSEATWFHFLSKASLLVPTHLSLKLNKVVSIRGKLMNRLLSKLTQPRA